MTPVNYSSRAFTPDPKSTSNLPIR